MIECSTPFIRIDFEGFYTETHTHTARQFLGETDFQLRVLLLWGSSAFSPVGRNDLLLSSKKKKTKNIPPPVAFDPYRPNSIRVCVYISFFIRYLHFSSRRRNSIRKFTVDWTPLMWERISYTHTHTQQTNSDHRLLLGSLSLLPGGVLSDCDVRTRIRE